MDRVPREGLDLTSTLFLHSEGTSAEAWSVDTQRANPGLHTGLHGFTEKRGRWASKGDARLATGVWSRGRNHLICEVREISGLGLRAGQPSSRRMGEVSGIVVSDFVTPAVKPRAPMSVMLDSLPMYGSMNV